MAEPVRIGVLGCGRIVQRGLIPGVSGSSEATLQAIASSREGVAEQWASKHGVPSAYDSYEQVLGDPDVDAVYIPCTGDLHARWTIQAAKAGKHVLCEKPLARSVAEAEQMLKAVASAGIIVQEAFMWRHHPRALRARELVQSGAIGPLRLIVASFSFDIDRGDWRMQPEKGGGAMWDIGCYGVNCSRYFADSEPVEHHARAHFSDTGVDMTMQIALRFPEDVLANIDCSFEAPFRCRAELVGERGRIELPSAFLPGESAELLLYRSVDRDAEPEREVFASNQYVNQIDAFARSIRAGSLEAPGEDGLANMRVLEAVLEDARRNRVGK